ncbi:MAG: tetratricopeptide repeat-containing sulfotransferase family protein [Isosphaeraceae bacterium]
MATNDPTGAARALQLEGRTAEAEMLFRLALAARADDVEALEGLAVLLMRDSRAGEAVGLLRRALAIRPDSARLHGHLGEALRSLGRLDEALGSLRRATELDPGFAPAWNSLGLLAHARGHHDYAETAFREAIRLGPPSVAKFLNLSNTFLARGCLAEAAKVLRRALEVQPQHAVAMTNLGRILAELRDRDRLDEAEALCRRAVELATELPHALNNLAHVLRIRGRLEEAREVVEQLQSLLGSRTPTGSEEEAGARGAISPTSHGPHAFSPHHARGLLAWKHGRLDEAEADFREALRVDPASVDSWLRLARIQQERGEVEESCRSARSALAVRPGLAEAYRMLAAALEDRLPDEDLRAIEGLLDDHRTSLEDRALLGFALGGVLDRRGAFAEAAARFDAANAAQARCKEARGLVFHPAANQGFVRKMAGLFTAEFLRSRRGWGDPDPRPVFIVGLPRSGTTLVEQVLARHPAVHGAGELQEISGVFRSLPGIADRAGLDPFVAMAGMTPAHCRAAARAYLDRLRAIAPPWAARVVDKQPDNVNYLGLIGLLWPGARVIHCRRDLRDVAVSCWQSGLVATSWNNDWESRARRFRDYVDLVGHWEKARPIAWLEVDYEEVVADLEGQGRRMIAYLGLEWDPACLEFHDRPGLVRTPSLIQVRRPVHTRSVGRWRNYEEFLGPMFRAFERHGLRAATRG